jgi:hypothetical protein
LGRAFPAAVLAVATAERLQPWLPNRPRLAPTAAFSAGGCAAVDLILLTIVLPATAHTHCI